MKCLVANSMFMSFLCLLLTVDQMYQERIWLGADFIWNRCVPPLVNGCLAVQEVACVAVRSAWCEDILWFFLPSLLTQFQFISKFNCVIQLAILVFVVPSPFLVRIIYQYEDMTDHRSYAYNLLKHLIIWNENLIQKYGYELVTIAILVQNLLLCLLPI